MKRLLDILVHSLYTDREIFLRELISNSSDALSKVQLTTLTEEVLDKDSPLEIRVSVNEKENSISIEDSGCGMTKEELINNLGTIASSGIIHAEAQDDNATGVFFETNQGREFSVYWAPGKEAHEETIFANGLELRGALAVVESNKVTVAGSNGLKWKTVAVGSPPGRQQGTIVALCRRDCWIDVAGITAISRGDRISVNPLGRAHTYVVTAVNQQNNSQFRLYLDMGSVHGHARITDVSGLRVELDSHIITRTATLHDTRLECKVNNRWQAIDHAHNKDAYTTTIHLSAKPEIINENHDCFTNGEWVSAVDYVIGDTVRLEIVHTFKFDF